MSTQAVLERRGISSGLNIDDVSAAGPAGISRAFPRRYGKSAARALALLGGDLSAFFCSSVLASAAVAFGDKPVWSIAYGRLQEFGIGWHGWGTLLVLAVLLSHLAGRGHYTQRIPFWTEMGDVVRSTGIALLVDVVLATKVYAVSFSAEAALRWALFVPLLLVLRSLGRAVLMRAGLGSLRTIIVGDAEATRAARAALSSDRSLGYLVVAEITFDRVSRSSEACPWTALMAAYRADFVVVALEGGESRKVQSVLASLALGRAPFAVIPTTGGLPVFGFDAQYFFSHDIMMLVNRGNLTRPLDRAVKQAFDYAAALLLMIAFAPAFIVIAWLIKRDGGPVFFRHERIGAFGHPFACLKFRTMAVDGDKVLRELLQRDPAAAAEWAATQKLRKDPRVTPIGHFLRATSLDELPQLLNVLRGEMSLVGPRPIVAAEAARYAEHLSYYTEAKPGLTGLWQVSGRSDTSYARRVELDVWYVKNWSFWHDVAILLKTVPAVLCRRGAV